jgi:hypothetical protein
MTGALRWSARKGCRSEILKQEVLLIEKRRKKLNLLVAVEMALCICNLPILANTDKASIPGIQREERTRM